MPKITFFNLANADSIRVDLASGKKILFDFADRHAPDDDKELRCDLPAELRKDLGKRKNFDVVAFTHLDNDHYDGATDFFYFEHIKKYQGDVDGKPRIKMDMLWVPAAVITESLGHGDDVEAKAIQKEARERFKAKAGIRVFSRPGRLQEWCDENGVNLDERMGLVTDAGHVAPGFSREDDGVEFFVHSPFAKRQDENTVEDRNNDALVMQATFVVDDVETKLFLASDIEYGIIEDIVEITENRDRKERLEWDIFKLPHHCSYKALGLDKGENKTVPVPNVKKLFETYGNDGGVVVSTSETIPVKGDDRDNQKHANPPHRQAAAYYSQEVADPKDGEFKVTMEHPSAKKPEPLVIEIDEAKATVVLAEITGAAAVISKTAPRAG